MSIYRLVDVGYPTFKKIMNGRKWVGRVCKTTDGYLGIIGPTQHRATTSDEAFREVVAKHLNFDSAASLAASNSEVRAINRARKAVAQHAVDEMLTGNFLPLDALFRKGK
jgi:hypothetical protein